MSAEKVFIHFRRFGKDLAKAEIYKSWAPFNTEAVLRLKRATGVVSRKGPILAVTLPLDFRVESSLPRRLKRGDVVFLPSMHSIAIVLKDVEKPSTAILAGKVIEGLEKLEKLPASTVITLIVSRENRRRDISSPT